MFQWSCPEAKVGTRMRDLYSMEAAKKFYRYRDHLEVIWSFFKMMDFTTWLWGWNVKVKWKSIIMSNRCLNGCYGNRHYNETLNKVTLAEASGLWKREEKEKLKQEDEGQGKPERESGKILHRTNHKRYPSARHWRTRRDTRVRARAALGRRLGCASIKD